MDVIIKILKNEIAIAKHLKANKAIGITLTIEQINTIINSFEDRIGFSEWCMKYMYSKHKDGFYRSPINVLAKFTIEELYQEHKNYKHLDQIR